MSEFEVAIVELSKIIAQKEMSIKAKDAEIRHMYNDNKELRLDLEEARKNAQSFKNDLFDLSKEFAQWKNLNKKFQEKKSEWDKHQDVKNGCTGPK